MTKNEIIDEISKLRAANNTGWMMLVKLAFQFAPVQAAAAMKEVADNDSKILVLARQLSE